MQRLGLQGPRLPARQQLRLSVLLCASVAGDRKASGQPFSIALPVRALGGLRCREVSSAVGRVGHTEGPPAGVPLRRSGAAAFDGRPLCCSAADAGVRARGYGDARPLAGRRRTVLLTRCQAFRCRRLPPRPPRSPPLHRLSAANSSPRPEVAPRPLNSSCPPRAFRDPAPVGECKAGQGLPDPHSIQLPQASRFTLSLKCFSSDSDICPPRGLDPCLSPPRAEGRSRPTDTPVFRRGRFTLPSLTRSCNTLSSSGQVLLSALSCCSARTCV